MTDDEKRDLIADLRAYASNGTGSVNAPAEMLRVAADALEGTLTEPGWEYGYELLEPDDRDVFERDGDFVSPAFAYRAAKKRIEEEDTGDVPRLHYLIVRRRKAGPWEVVSDV